MSKLFTLNTKDFLKGLLIAFLTGGITILQQSLDNGTLILNWKAILIASISGALAYLIKNFFTSEKGITQKEEAYTEQQMLAINECVLILDSVGLELVGTRPKDR